jgi:hypothetical protein
MRACREAPLKLATLARRGGCSNSTASTTIDGTLSNWGTKIVTGIRLFAFIALQQAMIAIARRSAATRREQSHDLHLREGPTYDAAPGARRWLSGMQAHRR